MSSFVLLRTGELVTKLLLGPVVTGGLLYALTASPPEYREPLLAKVREYLTPQNIDRSILALKWLFGIGAVSAVNKYLSELALNNFRFFSEKSKYDWPNEVIVITGATGGFGSLMSKELSAKGAKIVAIDLRDELPVHMKSLPKIAYYKCDITDRAAVAATADKIRAEHGDPSVLINNAGISGDGTIMDQSQKSLEAIFKVNVISHYYTVQEFLPAMARKNKGHVVTLASVASFVAPPSLVPYANTKVAAMAFDEGLRQETRCLMNANAVKFTIVHPTFAATPMVAPFSGQLAAARAQVISPELVSNAIVKQVLSCRSGRLVIAPGTEAVQNLRSLPIWLSQGLLQIADSNLKKMATNLQKRK